MISLYLENPVNTNLDGSFIRAALTHVTLETDENVNTGSKYDDENLQGVTLGFGVKRDMPTGDGFYKIIKLKNTYEKPSEKKKRILQENIKRVKKLKKLRNRI